MRKPPHKWLYRRNILINNINFDKTLIHCSQIKWSRRIYRLHLCRGGKIYSKSCHGYDIKQSDDKAPVMEIERMRSIPSLPSLPGPLWPRMVALDRVQCMGQIEQTLCANKWLMLNCDCYIAILETILLCAKKSSGFLRILSTKCVYKSYIVKLRVIRRLLFQ